MPPQVLQLPVTYRRYHKHARAYDTADGSHLVAWGFLRPAGPPPSGPEAPRQPLLGRLKLQLYEYKRGGAGGPGHRTVPRRTRRRTQRYQQHGRGKHGGVVDAGAQVAEQLKHNEYCKG